jgi:surface polysaccharide O-acyltransferase-like enzyme
VKSVLAVLVGYLVFGISAILLFQVAGVDPQQEPQFGFRIWSTLYGVFFALAGGYIAARIAGKKEVTHASAVACILAVIATVSLIAQPGHGLLWSQIAALGFMTPAAILGGVVRARQVRIKD